jgi:hypothetical protein
MGIDRQPRSPRVNISVPFKLHQAMLKVGREANWSAIAAKAFAEHIAAKGKTDLSAACVTISVDELSSVVFIQPR